MATSYKKLWKLLIDRDMKKKDLRILTGLSSSTIAKMTKNEAVSTDVLVKVCSVLNCDIGDIIEIVSDSNKIKE
jgi:DNA-binding Xre family transcriptional regulator